VSRPPLDLVVVGAGVGGLAAAWRARRAGRSVAVLEASGRAGGVLRTDFLGPYRVERAAATFPTTASNLLALLASLPSPPPVREPPPAANRQFLLGPRGLVEVVRSPRELVLAGVVSPLGAARALAEALRGPRRGGRPESAHAFVRRRLGAEVADRLLAPMTRGIHGTHPRALGVVDAFPALAAMEREHGGVIRALAARRGASARRALSLEGGMESLPRAIASALGEGLSLSTPVSGVAVDGEGVAVATGGGDRVLARRCLLAVPASEQARLVAGLSAGAAEILATVRSVPMVVVAVGLPPGGSPPVPEAFGFLRGPGSRARVLGASFPSRVDASCAPEGHALVTAFLGGGDDPAALELDDGAVREVVLRDLAAALGGPVRPDATSVWRWPRAIPVLSPGHAARMARAQALLPPSVRLGGSHVTGVALDACVAPRPGE
jgi:oxygen-dependent protoporphyrinogen oxidase